MGLASPGHRLMFSRSAGLSGRIAPWSLSWYVLWRLVGAAVVIFVVLTLVFFAVEVLPGDPSRFILPTSGNCGPGYEGSVECHLRSALIQQWGLDKPFLDRYLNFLSNVVQGNLGISTTLRPGIPVWDLIALAVPNTLILTGFTLVFVAVLSLAFGLPMGRQKGSHLDALASFFLALPFAATVVTLGTLAILIFGVTYPLFPIYGGPGPAYPGTNPLAQVADYLWHLILPISILVAASVGLFTWMVRDDPLGPRSEAVPSPPSGRKGSTTRLGVRLLTIVPRLLVCFPALLPWTVGAVLLAEVVGGLNGVGRLLWNAVISLDLFIVVGVVVVVTLLVVLPGVVASDILRYALTTRWDREDGARAEIFHVRPRDLWDGFMRIVRSGLGLTGLALILALIVMSVAAPVLVGPYPTALTRAFPSQPPSPQHLLGTDERGRDILTLTAYGGAQAIPVALMAFALALIAELAFVAAIGFFGPRAEVFVMIPVDLFLVLSVPFLILLAITSGASVLVLPALFGWPVATSILRMELRGMVDRMPRSSPPSRHLRARGHRTLNLIWGTGPLIVGEALLAVALAISLWAAMGFLGLGPGGTGATLSWGQMFSNAYTYLALLRGEWWYFLPPSICIFLAVLGPMLLSLAFKAVGPTARTRGESTVMAPERTPLGIPSQ